MRGRESLDGAGGFESHWARGRLAICLLGLALMACGPSPELAEEKAGEGEAASALEVGRHTFASAHMGTEVRLVIYSPDPASARAGADLAFDTFSRLDSLFSDYRADSEIAGLAENAGSDFTTSPELHFLLNEAAFWYHETEGAFDVTVGPLTKLWRWSLRRGELPPADRLAVARALVDGDDLLLRHGVDGGPPRVQLARMGMSLDLGGIAKGYAAQVVLDQLIEAGLSQSLVDAGGDLALGDPPPGEPGWRVEFPDGGVHRLSNTSVATSGDEFRFVEVDGVRYSHIIDPRSGLGVPDAPTVVVVAPDGTTADVLASTLTVIWMDTIAVRMLLDGHPDVSGKIIPRAPGAAMWESADFPGR